MKKNTRSHTIIECIKCSLNLNKRLKGISRYITSKSKKNTPKKLEIKKYCKFCNEHTIHKEIK